jgi:hypothetical protein
MASVVASAFLLRSMMRRLIAVLSFSFLLASASAQNQAPGPTLTLAQFQAQLDQLNLQVTSLEAHPETAEALRSSLPKQWTVTGGPRPVEVSAATLDDALSDFQKQDPSQKKSTLRELHTQLLAMREEAGNYTQPDATAPAMHKRLDGILAAREFKDVHGPSVFDQLLERAEAWLQKWWDKLFGKIHLTPPSVEWVGSIFVWVVICAAACVLVVWLFRIYQRRPEEYIREIMPFAPSAKSWRIWLAEAKEQAARGDWRNAIHLSYWASVSYLEVSGLWSPDRARTPREYLRAIDARDPKKPPFTSLTLRFEGVWYGSRRAHADDFDAALAELEKLGCQ